MNVAADGARTRSDGRSAEIHLRIVGAERPRHVAIDAVPFIAPDKGVPAQTVSVFVNDHPLGPPTVNASQTFRFEIPEAALGAFDGLLRLRFEFANAASPERLGLSPDARLLGLGFVCLTVL